MKNYLDEGTLDSLMEGFQVIDFDWKYAYVNETVARHGKSTKSEFIGKTMMEKYPGIEETEMFATLRECMRTRTSASISNEFVFPDGTSQWFELRVQPVPEGLFILSADISERKKAEEALQKMNESLESQIALRTSELKIKNKDLTDSIEYAQRIQQSRLPTKAEIQNILPRNFILFKPKDIVS
jgi:PAS domain S-box-containing protein